MSVAYHTLMQSLRRFRKLIVLVALIWLPMTVFAQVCATQCLVMSMQTSGVFAHAVDSQSAKQATTSNAAVFVAYASSFASGDSDDHDCDMKAVCAFAALIPLTSAQHDLSVSVIRDAVPTMGVLFASYRSIADTPPPRTSL